MFSLNFYFQGKIIFYQLIAQKIGVYLVGKCIELVQKIVSFPILWKKLQIFILEKKITNNQTKYFVCLELLINFNRIN